MEAERQNSENALLNKDYQKIRLLGSGGDGAVYLVRHLPTEQLRAAKCLRTDQPSKRLRELELMKRLHHRSLPQILDVLRCDGRLWLIMEYVSGRSLVALPREERSMEQFFSISGQLTATLQYLHTRPVPILHLDLKPANVLLRQDGSLVLIDFGAAIPENAGKSEGRYGTPGFAAPEQGRREGKVDARADIYGLGALLYFYLYGEAPGNGAEKLRHAAGSHGVLVNRRIRRILAKCLRNNPEARFSDCCGVARAISAVEKWYKWKKQLQKASGALLLLIFVLSFALLFPGEPKEAMEEAEQQKEEEYSQLLKRAETSGLDRAAELYGEAATLEPEKNDWCFALIERIGEDYLFDKGEEDVLKELLYMILPDSYETFLERQQKKEAAYGEIAYRIGLLYWYFYAESGGKSAAARWFEEAVAAPPETEKSLPWLESAQIHAEISGYFEKLGRRDENGSFQVEYPVYWQDLKSLWETASLQKESIGIRGRIADEILSCLILHINEIREAGENRERAEQYVASVEDFLRTEADAMEETERERRREQCGEARSAIARMYSRSENEGGLHIEE